MGYGNMENANSSGRRTPKKTTLDLESNTRSTRNDQYVRSIIAQKQVKMATMINVLHRALERFGGIKIMEATNRVKLEPVRAPAPSLLRPPSAAPFEPAPPPTPPPPSAYLPADTSCRLLPARSSSSPPSTQPRHK